MKSIDEMTPEEIRQEIAERRGWSYVVVSHKYTALPDGKLSEGIPIYGYIFNGGVSYPPDWPASIAAAWELVDDMDNNGKWVQMRTPFIDDGYWCGCTPKGITGWNGTPDLWMNAPTAPLAICKAWLAWKRSEEK
jgi:hypothetical protein